MNPNHLKNDLIALLLVAPVVGIASAGCKPQTSTSTASTTASTAAPAAAQGDIVRMQVGTETFTLEVADSEGERAWGLMERESMPADHGMIFLFEEESPRAFWMRNTLIPLDIIYVNAAGRVVSVKPMQPKNETPVPSDGPMMYAIELNLGAAARAGVKAGDTIAIPKDIASRLSGR